MTPYAVRSEPRLPPSLIVVKDGKVVRVDQWVLWNQQPWKTIEIVRNPDGSFFSSIGDPEHGGGSASGTLEKVLDGLHPEVKAKYRRLFDLDGITGIRSLGEKGPQVLREFQGYRIQFPA